MTIHRVKELPGLTVSRPSREASFLKGPGPSTILPLTWTLGQKEEGPFCSVAGCNFILKMSPNLMQQQKAGAGSGGYKWVWICLLPKQTPGLFQEGLQMPSDLGERGRKEARTL